MKDDVKKAPLRMKRNRTCNDSGVCLNMLIALQKRSTPQIEGAQEFQTHVRDELADFVNHVRTRGDAGTHVWTCTTARLTANTSPGLTRLIEC